MQLIKKINIQIRFTATALFILVSATYSFAQASATATASASAVIITPLTIVKNTDINFGNVAVGTTAGTVVLTPGGSRSTTGGVTLPAITGTFTAASFAVAGMGTSTYSITLPSAALTLTSGSNTMTASVFKSTPSGTGALTAGIQTLTVGATLNVGAAQPAGLYVSAGFPVTICYN